MCLDCPIDEVIELGDLKNRLKALVRGWAYEDGVDLESVAIPALVEELVLDYRAQFYGAQALSPIGGSN